MGQEHETQDQPESWLRVAKLNLLNQDNKSYLIYSDKLVSMLIKFENTKDHLDSLSLLRLTSIRYKDYYINATQVEVLNEEMYLVYDLEDHSFLDFNTAKLDYISPFTSLIIFKNYMKSLFTLLTLNEDFREFDSKFLFFNKCSKSGLISIKYLYHGKVFLLIQLSPFIQE